MRSNNWSCANIWYQRWLISKKHMHFEEVTADQQDILCRQAVIANANYVMYLAQEWAGVRK